MKNLFLLLEVVVTKMSMMIEELVVIPLYTIKLKEAREDNRDKNMYKVALIFGMLMACYGFFFRN